MLNNFFNRSEFACKCGCGFDTVDCELLKILTNVRLHFNKPTIITSGCRCKSHNLKIGGATNSFHIKAKASDIQVRDIKPLDVYEFLCNVYPNKYGFILYSNWVHVDSRDIKYRDIKSKKGEK